MQTNTTLSEVPQARPRRRTGADGAPVFAETQRERILALFLAACGAWVPLPEIMACAAQYNARVLELRRLGFVIENKTERVNGARHSWFRLVGSPAPALSSSFSERKPSKSWEQISAERDEKMRQPEPPFELVP